MSDETKSLLNDAGEFFIFLCQLTAAAACVGILGETVWWMSG